MANLEKEDKLSGIKDLDGLIHSPARLAIMANLFVLKNADFTFLVNLTKLSSKVLSVGYILSSVGRIGCIAVKPS